MLSATIITFNEEKNIGRCIDSLNGVADEIIVVDSFSADATEKICNSKNVRFIQHKFDGHIQQKNFAMEQATHPMVLSLDADECLSNELKKSLLRIKQQPEFDGYFMNRKNNFCGKWIRHCGWYPDRKLRLWKKEIGSWGGMNPHDKVVMNEGTTTVFLKGDLLHYTATSVEQFKLQQERFAAIAAKEIYEKGKKSNLILNVLRASLMFVRKYFFQLGFLDGYYGWVICSEGAKYTFRKYMKSKTLLNDNTGRKK
ncbi:MAG: glycosyltransferase family 2 protein [Chitinophagales bacterium]|nr:glycosyltransferase family 2 protein [Chitinophagales bacterium]